MKRVQCVKEMSLSGLTIECLKGVPLHPIFPKAWGRGVIASPHNLRKGTSNHMASRLHVNNEVFYTTTIYGSMPWEITKESMVCHQAKYVSSKFRDFFFKRLSRRT